MDRVIDQNDRIIALLEQLVEILQQRIKEALPGTTSVEQAFKKNKTVSFKTVQGKNSND